MRRFWWPEPLYEARPYGAMTIGLLVGALAVARSVALGHWDLPFVAALLAGCGAMAYAAVVLKLRHAYRSRSRWQRERRG